MLQGSIAVTLPVSPTMFVRAKLAKYVISITVSAITVSWDPLHQQGGIDSPQDSTHRG